jgi:hypothetical protein
MSVRSFAEVQAELGLQELLQAERGTMFVSGLETTQEINSWTALTLVRTLDGFITPELKDDYVEMVAQAAKWIAAHPELDHFVEVLPISEVGTDFIARPHVLFSYATSAYNASAEDLSVPDAPEELELMREAFSAARGVLKDPKSKIMERVLERNIMSPSGLTVFDGEGQFLILEPHINAADLQEWAAL